MKEWFEINKKKLAAITVLLIVVVVYYYTQVSEKDISVIGEEIRPLVTQQKQTEEAVITEKPMIIMVDVKGAVRRPGVYVAKEGERVIDLINKAGGFTSEADQNQVNLSQHVADEMVIFVPKIGEVGGNLQNGTTAVQESKLINLNKATEVELQTLPGIGPSKALAIIEYREMNNGFQTIDDLKEISGIGEKTFEKLESLITVK